MESKEHSLFLCMYRPQVGTVAQGFYYEYYLTCPYKVLYLLSTSCYKMKVWTDFDKDRDKI